MAVFAYQGTGAKGEKRSGEVDAPTRSEALRKLAMDRIQPLSLVAKSDAAGLATPSSPARAKTRSGTVGAVRLKKADVILITDELSDFLHAGLQLEPALQLMENREERSPVKDVSRFPARESARRHQLFRGAESGVAEFRRALLHHLVAAGEVSGAMGAVAAAAGDPSHRAAGTAPERDPGAHLSRVARDCGRPRDCGDHDFSSFRR